jgi:hypothetical protein
MRSAECRQTGPMETVEIDSAWLTPTWFIDSDDESVGRFADEAIGDATDPTEQAIRLFVAVQLAAQMKTDLFAWHGYSELLLGDRWFKLSTAFNIELCRKFGVKVLEFDGTDDALMHPFDEAGNRHMEYVNQRGSFDDLPLERILADFEVIYGTDMAQRTGGGSAAEAGDDAFT